MPPHYLTYTHIFLKRISLRKRHTNHLNLSEAGHTNLLLISLYALWLYAAVWLYPIIIILILNLSLTTQLIFFKMGNQKIVQRRSVLGLGNIVRIQNLELLISYDQKTWEDLTRILQINGVLKGLKNLMRCDEALAAGTE